MKLYTVEEVAKMFSLSTVTIYRMVKDGRIKSIKVGNQYRISEQEVDRIMKEGA